MSMKTWLLIITPLYVILLGTLAIRSRRGQKSETDFLLGNAKLGLVIGLLTTAASLFSAFTLQGMPDFFRQHGIGAWIFLAVSDAFMVFGIIWFAYHLRKKVRSTGKGFNGVGGMLAESYRTPWAGIVYFVGVFIFLVPYVAIQIRGITIFLEATFPSLLPDWGWALAIVVLMLLYSETGGLKAIIYADVMQAVLLMIVVWVIAYTCVNSLGGITAMFEQVEQQNAALLSTPGPKNLFSGQFLFASMIGIVFIPITQPHITTRLVIMKSINETHRMAMGLGVFAMMVILPTLAIGFYGAIRYAELPTDEFLSQVLLFDQLGIIAALGIVGLVAASISTSDSQIFALGTEFRMLLGKRVTGLLTMRITIIVFAVAALVFSLMSSDELVLLTRASFTGTAMMGPLILAAILRKNPPAQWLIPATALGLLTFLLTQFNVIPKSVLGLSLDWLIIAILGILAFLARSSKPNHEPNG
jgi:SSS family solute:Na+ symporter